MSKDAIPFRLSAPKALQIIREAAADSARVFFTRHAEARMKKRHITRVQVLRCLRNGTITEAPVFGLKGNWECRVECRSGGEHIGVALAIVADVPQRYIVVITVFHVR